MMCVTNLLVRNHNLLRSSKYRAVHHMLGSTGHAQPVNPWKIDVNS